jgi:hypothetical protein
MLIPLFPNRGNGGRHEGKPLKTVVTEFDHAFWGVGAIGRRRPGWGVGKAISVGVWGDGGNNWR